MYERQMRIFDYPKFAEPFRNQLRENAETLAKENGIEIEFVRKRKELVAVFDFLDFPLPDYLFWLYCPMRPVTLFWRHFLKKRK